MRMITVLGFALLATGAIVLVASSGAFDATTADRGVGVETAADENAFLGIEDGNDLEDRLPTEDREIELDSDDNDGGGFCFFGCADYEYNDEELLVFTDNTPDGELEIQTESVDVDDDDIVGGEELRIEDDQGIGVVRGDFRCEVSGFLGSVDQQPNEATITVDVVASDGEITTDLEREIDVECLAD